MLFYLVIGIINCLFSHSFLLSVIPQGPRCPVKSLTHWSRTQFSNQSAQNNGSGLSCSPPIHIQSKSSMMRAQCLRTDFLPTCFTLIRQESGVSFYAMQADQKKKNMNHKSVLFLLFQRAHMLLSPLFKLDVESQLADSHQVLFKGERFLHLCKTALWYTI